MIRVSSIIAIELSAHDLAQLAELGCHLASSLYLSLSLFFTSHF